MATTQSVPGPAKPKLDVINQMELIEFEETETQLLRLWLKLADLREDLELRLHFGAQVEPGPRMARIVNNTLQVA